MGKNNTAKKRIAVIFGGRSGEHEVSLKSAYQVISALDKNKYEIIPVAITKVGYWLVGEKGRKYLEDNLGQTGKQGGVKSENNFEDRNKFPEKFPSVDLVLPIMHGTFGEDGKLQGMLEMLGLPYVFSGVLASSLAMNKRKTKIIAKASGLKIAKDVIVIRGKKFNTEKIIAKLNFPIVIKPSELGSSVGTSLANAKEELENGIKEAFKYGEEVLLEQFVKGRELTVTVMGDKSPKALPVIEIIPKISGWFDYRAKYETGGSEEVCPAEISEEILKKIQRYAVKVFKAVGCLDLARADFIWSAEDGKLYFLEINTIPGMTATSLAPQAAAAAGMEFSVFLDKLIEGAIRRNEKEQS
ncbi:MAG: D-alanine-D-alanine ligase [Candidatus Moranbacteria bacterium GW2011_GWE2_35_2-]|nr:MAG: D-alanine-D-alanine ligase [Candidatus Moranbacteria bacterium GW2011_GWE2_35_2-]KKQ03962.1 MAG: D-alanine-D-alanine ligase [Candidatus Moranbacteria bacterium GW2011_GWF1_36_4]KKQ22448.1 MAG: D-alanine-D-alanine ligase [Candidatus Moranbacteria bacterium GW2011_GWF2_37_11]KKQ29517.1 MAG: D-alanine-D-alanine ligase [Candidatus Moranbacteria bacterium GW2011_GWD1_37_17]KKQ30613.1 MAG: D-alanine-D-alanine ligase [Candidatus Moranbacteria bacterium GW2011_GWE1_37_24]KKQ48163.1 MAG: D-alan